MSQASSASKKEFNPIKGVNYSTTYVSNIHFDHESDKEKLKLYANEPLRYIKLEESMGSDEKNGQSAYAILDGFILPESLNDITIEFSYTTLDKADSEGKYFATQNQEKSYWKTEPLTKNLNHNYIGNSFIRISRKTIKVPGQQVEKPCLYITNVNPSIPLMGFKLAIKDIAKISSFPNSSTFISLKTDDLGSLQKPYTWEDGITLNHNLPIPIDQILFNVIDARRKDTPKSYPGLRLIKSSDPSAPQTVLDGFMSISGITPNPGEFNLKFNVNKVIELIPDALLVNVAGPSVTIIFTDSSPKISKSGCMITRVSKNAEVKVADQKMPIKWVEYWNKDTGKFSGRIFNVIGKTIENGVESRRMRFKQSIGDLIPNKKPDGTRYINDDGVLFVSKPLIPGILAHGWGSGVANPDDASEIRLAFRLPDGGQYTILPFAVYAEAPMFEDEIDLHLGNIQFDFDQNQATFSANLKVTANWKN